MLPAEGLRPSAHRTMHGLYLPFLCHSRRSGNPGSRSVIASHSASLVSRRRGNLFATLSRSAPLVPHSWGTRRDIWGHPRPRQEASPPFWGTTFMLPAEGLRPSAPPGNRTGTACRVRTPACGGRQRAAALFSRSIMATPMPFSSVFSMMISSTASSSSSRNTAKICLAYSSSSCGMILTMGRALPLGVK